MPGDPFYWSPRWRELRAAVLRERRICEAPGCPKQSKHVDHVIPRSRGGAAFDRRNLAVYCHSCHSRKTARRDGGFGNPVRNGVAGGCDENGMPLDPAHAWLKGRKAAQC